MSTYTTQQGDMWDSIAHRLWGTVALTDRLMWANRQYLRLCIFPAGIVLMVPETPAQRPAAGMPPWKQ